MAWNIVYQGDPPQAAVFPLEAHASGRYLVDQQGNPFLLIGESSWFLTHKMTLAEVDAYIADRKARGYNAVMTMLMAHDDTILPNIAPNTNANGDAAFTTTPWLVPANVNEDYFAHCDAIFNKFLAAGMVCLVAMAYYNTSYRASITSDAVGQNWGEWVGARYNAIDFPNIIWVGGGDERPSSYTAGDALNYGVHTAGGTQLHTLHNDRYHNGFEEIGDYANGATWLTLNNVYNDDGTTNGSPYTIPEQFIIERNDHTVPVFLIEDWYLNEHDIDATEFINQKYQAMCSGACGFNTGSDISWTLMSGYADDWDNVAYDGVTKLRALFLTYNWWTGVPKQDASLVSSSLGTQGPSRICPILGDYAGGKWAIISVPTATSPTVVMTNFSQSSVRARWMDPFTGSFTNVSGQPFGNTGSQSMTHPGNNSQGTPLQILVLDAA